jgi:hypothetical protein
LMFEGDTDKTIRNFEAFPVVPLFVGRLHGWCAWVLDQPFHRAAAVVVVSRRSGSVFCWRLWFLFREPCWRS